MLNHSGRDTNDAGAMDKVGQMINQMDSGEKERILGNFQEFKSYLSGKIRIAEKLGMGEEHMARVAEKVGDYLSRNEQPRNSEEMLLQELWKVGEKEERHHLAHMLVRLAQDSEETDSRGMTDRSRMDSMNDMDSLDDMNNSRSFGNRLI